jgi:tetratricopeptide (TPR) repeat protein
MRRARLLWLAATVLAVLAAVPAAYGAGGASNKDAKRIYEEATAAFGLGRYAEAAEKYEAAFGVRPDPALLYNAAQAYRLAGNRQRALELYRNYVRLYPDGTNAEDARSHVVALKKAIEDERPPIEMARPPGAPPSPAVPPPPPVASPPAPPATPAMPPPVETRPPAPLPPAPPPPASDTGVAMVAKPAAQGDEQKPLTHQTWFWVVVGAGVAAVATTIVLVAARGEKFPDASFGTARGN